MTHQAVTSGHGIDGPFIDDFPIKPSIYKGFSMAMLNNQRVYTERGVVEGTASHSLSLSIYIYI